METDSLLSLELMVDLIVSRIIVIGIFKASLIAVSSQIIWGIRTYLF